ncbi:MAG: hypothetical protein KJP00_10365 [Bacteroidia bacterium]|nr:hypothetical protein [Bacteroidia bacterium]
MKMYILIRDAVPDQLAPVIAAHASLACYKKFEDDPDMQEWMNSIFYKVVCKVNDTEFEKAQELDKCLSLTESSLENKEVCLVFCPRVEYPRYFKFFRMWKPNAK